jgi:hypothetical protein
MWLLERAVAGGGSLYLPYVYNRDVEKEALRTSSESIGVLKVRMIHSRFPLFLENFLFACEDDVVARRHSAL